MQTVAFSPAVPAALPPAHGTARRTTPRPWVRLPVIPGQNPLEAVRRLRDETGWAGPIVLRYPARKVA